MPRNFKPVLSMIAFSIFFVICLQLQIAKADQIELVRGGQIDYSFTPPTIYLPIDENVRSFAIQPDGKILAVGTFMPSSPYKLVRFLPDGQVDNSFNPYYPASNTGVEDFTLQQDGKILYNKLTNGVSTIFRLNPDGSLDTSFNYQSNGYIPKMIVLPDGKILIINALGVKRLNSNGEIDTSFSFTPLSNVSVGNKFSVQPNGKIVIFGQRYNGSSYVAQIYRYNSDGSIDNSFQANPIAGNILDFAVQPDGKVLAMGISYTSQATIYSFKRFNSNGSDDSSFQPQNTIKAFESIALQNDGKILISGSVSGNPRTERLFADGSLDTSFVSYFVKGAIYPNSDGTIFLRGPNTINGRAVGIVKLKGNYTPTRQKAFDFDDDGKSDISVFRPSTGVWYWINSSNGTFSAVQFGLSEDTPVPADYDGDAKADIAVYRPSTGIWHLLSSSSGQYSAFQFGIASDIPTPNDYDGDNKDDISVYRPSTGVWYRVNSSTNQVAIQQFGNPDDKPVQGDYDSDGKSDVAVWKPSTGIWSYFSSLNNSVKTYQLGFDSDKLAPADYDGDGKTDFAIWRSANGGWYGYRSFVGNGFFFIWGVAGDIPTPADFDGDGKDDIAIYRPSTGTWWIGRTSDGVIVNYAFGLNGDIPLPSTFVR